jgi:hypothetical protein
MVQEAEAGLEAGEPALPTPPIDGDGLDPEAPRHRRGIQRGRRPSRRRRAPFLLFLAITGFCTPEHAV